jgi:hypothetical protein
LFTCESEEKRRSVGENDEEGMHFEKDDAQEGRGRTKRRGALVEARHT